MHEEALGTLIDYHVGFANIDQAAYTKAMPPSSFVTSPIGYIRLHGRNPADWQREFGRASRPIAAHDYLYSKKELLEWKPRIEHVQQHSARTFVFANNDVGGKSVANALQLRQMLGDERRSRSGGLDRAVSERTGGLSFRPAGPERAVPRVRIRPPRCGVREAIHFPRNGSNTGISKSWKSLVFRVTTVRRWMRAVAASIASSSNWSGRPTIKRAHSRKSRPSMGNIW